MINVNASVKSTVRTKKDNSWNPSTCICENRRCLKGLLMIQYEIINTIDSVSTNVTNSIPTNGTSTVSMNSGDKKVLHTFLLVTILIFLIASICYHYTKHKSKQKRIEALTI